MRWYPVAAMMLLVACQRQGAADNASAVINASEAPAVPPSTPIASPKAPPTLADAASFVPLGSDQVKDAVHRALRTGTTQRWQDGALSGYAVPSTTTDAHGCRAVRYTVDQLREAPPQSINACEG